MEHPLSLWHRLRRSSSLAAGPRRQSRGLQAGYHEAGLFLSNVGDDLTAMIGTAKPSRPNAEAPQNFEYGLLPLAELARRVDDGDQYFGHDLWSGGQILAKPAQDANEHRAELIRLEHTDLSYRSHVRIR
jgi:hypothetical protein